MATRKRKREIQEEIQPETRPNFESAQICDSAKAPSKRQKIDRSLSFALKPPLVPLSARKLRRRTPRKDPNTKTNTLKGRKKSSVTSLSLTSIKTPILTLKGTVQKKVAKAIRHQSMRGLKDYSLPLEKTTNFEKYMDEAERTKEAVMEKCLPLAALASHGSTSPQESSSSQSELVIGDLDVFYYRQMASSLKDAELQQKIEREIKMRDGTAKLLAASKHPAQLLEAAKSLLTSNSRVLAYMSELQKRKSEEILKKQESPASVEGDQLPCKAKFAVADIRIPLMWKDTDHFKNKGDHRRYAVFCLLKIGTDIYDTTLVKDVDRSKTDITFDDVIIFDSIPPDFKCDLEVYSHQLHEDVSIASTPKKIKKKINDISSSMGRSVGRRLSGLKEDEIMNSMLVGPRFDLVAHSSLILKDVRGSIGTYDLVIDATPRPSPENTKPDGTSSQDLPMFGNFCCHLAAQPYCLIKETLSGYLHVKKHTDSPDASQWQRYWCSLKNLQLSCWLQAENAGLCEPDYSIPVTKISEAPVSTCSRSFGIHVMSQGGIFACTVAAESKDDRSKWWEAFQQHLLDQALWRHACDRLMEIRNPTPKRIPSFLMRKPSLYDEIGTSIDSADEDTRSTSSQDSASGGRGHHSPITKQISLSYELPNNQF